MSKLVLMLFGVFLLALSSCDVPVSEQPPDKCAGLDLGDLSGWKTIGPATPIVCQGKVVGYQADLDGTKDRQSFALTTDAPLPADGYVSLFATVDIGAGANHSVKIMQDGSALDINNRASPNLEAHALVTKGTQTITYQVQVEVPQGVIYRGRIFNVRKK